LAGDPRRIVVKRDNDTLVLVPADPPQTFADNHWHRSRGGWLAWLRQDPAPAPVLSSLLMGHILTERPVYRPEDEVHIKGYLRVRDNGRLKIPPEDKYMLLISGPGDRTWTPPVLLTAEGSFYHRFQDKDLPTGKYCAVLKNVRTQATYGAAEWKMEPYRIPRFEVELHGPDKVAMDRPFTLTATAKYYAGGRLVGEPTRWRVTQLPYVYTPPMNDGFVFSADERYSKSGRFAAPGAIEKREVTDESGASRISINPAIELDARPRRYIFEVTVTGADEQTVTNTRQIIALPPAVLGLKVERFQTATKRISPEIIALDPEGKLLAGQEVTVRLLQRQWHSTLTETDFSTRKVKYLTDVVDQEVCTTKVTTKDRPVAVQLPTETAGIYVVEVSSRDKGGRLQLVTVDLYVGGAEALTWKKPEANVFETTPDKTLYSPGDTARILLKSPYQTAHVLAVIEGPDGNVYQELGVEGGKAVFALPIHNEYNPRLPVHFLLMRGRVAGAFTGKADLGRPGTMAATSWLKVDPRENRLNVQLSHPEKALPGQEISVTIKLSTLSGRPTPGEVTLWLADQAVLSLGKERELDPLPSFIRDVKSQLAIRDTRNKTIGDIVTEENPAGGGTEEPGLLGRLTPRKRFKTVPYFNPRIMIDSTGIGTVTFKLSDDITTFKVRAVAATVPDRFGFAKSTIAVRLPVIVQPALPRFARISDNFTAGGIGRIVEGDGGPGRFEVKADGAVVSGPSSGTLSWLRDKPQKLFFPIKVVAPTGKGHELSLTLAVRRNADKAQDAFEVRLPVLPDREPVHAEIFTKLSPGQPVSFPEFDRNVREGSVRQEVVVTDQEAILKMLAALDYLHDYPYECTEQRVSQSYPIVALRSLLDTFKLNVNRERDDEIFAATLDTLGRTLQPSGLYSFWPGSAGQVSLTAYVVQFLMEAKRSGRVFSPRLLERPVAALKEALRSDYSGFVDGEAFTERCEALRALSVAGAFDEGYGAELARKAATMNPYGKSEVLLAYAAAKKGGDEITKTIRSDLWNNTIFKLRDGREAFGGFQSGAQAGGDLILASETRTLATMIRALYPDDKSNPRMGLLLDELIKSGDKDGWGNTNTNAAALLALRDVVNTPRALTSPARFDVTSGQKKLALVLDSVHPTAHLVTDSTAPSQITWTGGAQGAAFHARLNVSCIPVATGDTVPAHSAGFVVRQEIVRIPDGNGPPARTWIENEGQTLSFTLSEVVEEHVQVINPQERNFVAVVVPLAAGMEPLNPNLQTSPPEAKPSAPLTLEPAYSTYRDDAVCFYHQTLPAGTYDYYFRTRAGFVGSFVHPGAHVEMMYQPSVRGNSAGIRYVVQKRAGD